VPSGDAARGVKLARASRCGLCASCGGYLRFDVNHGEEAETTRKGAPCRGCEHLGARLVDLRQQGRASTRETAAISPQHRIAFVLVIEVGTGTISRPVAPPIRMPSARRARRSAGRQCRRSRPTPASWSETVLTPRCTPPPPCPPSAQPKPRNHSESDPASRASLSSVRAS